VSRERRQERPPVEAGRLDELKRQVRALSEFNATHVRELVMHFQTLISARESRVFMEAPGLYYRDLGLYVISTSGLTRGHATLWKSLEPVLPPEPGPCYAFVLYPGSFIRSCFDRVLRRTAKIIGNDLRLSMENVFNRKHHPGVELVGSAVERELVCLLKEEM